MLVFMRRRRELHPNDPIHSEKEYEILCKCMQREKDCRLRKRIEDAIRRFYSYRAGLEKGDPAFLESAFQGKETSFVDAEVELRRLQHLTDIEYGIVFKKTDEFGVFSFCVIDSGKTIYTYYRSDFEFKERHVLM